MQKHLEEQNWKEFRIIAHAIKGASLLVGANNFSEKAKEQEFAGKGEKYDFIVESLPEFLDLYEKMLEAVKVLVDSE